jgi:hypothetical protein
MQSKSILDYIVFGTGLRYLQDASENWSVHENNYVLDNIDRFFANLDKFELPVTQCAAYELRQFRDELTQSDTDHRLSAGEASELRKIMSDVRKTLFAEAEGNIAFIVTDKRIDVNKLLSDVPALMAPDIFDALPDIAQCDFIELLSVTSSKQGSVSHLNVLQPPHFTYCEELKRYCETFIVLL